MLMKFNPKLEITAQDVFSVKAAISGDADRIELCSALGVAGLTPSDALIKQAVKLAKKANKDNFVDVLIRPREGDFVYTEDEISTILLDIENAVSHQVNAIVVGILNEDQTVNVEAMKRCIEVSKGVPLVFHRAFDVIENQFEALDQIIELGCIRLLTSGGKPTTREGIERISELVNIASGRIEIMAGGGAKIEDFIKLKKIGVDAIHISSRKEVVGKNNRPGENAVYIQADIEVIKKAKETLKK